MGDPMGLRAVFVVLLLSGLAASASAGSPEGEVGAALRRAAAEAPRALATAGREVKRAVTGVAEHARHEMEPAAAGTAERTRREAERAGRSTARWLKHAGAAVAAFFRGLGEGLSGPSETR